MSCSLVHIQDSVYSCVGSHGLHVCPRTSRRYPGCGLVSCHANTFESCTFLFLLLLLLLHRHGGGASCVLDACWQSSPSVFCYCCCSPHAWRRSTLAGLISAGQPHLQTLSALPLLTLPLLTFFAGMEEESILGAYCVLATLN